MSLTRKPWPRKQYDRPPRTPITPSVRAGTYSTRGIEASPKGEKAKTGKRKPTKLEAQWMDAIVAHGCVACRIDGLSHQPAEVHHVLRGGVRMGHLYTLPLCTQHHRGGECEGRFISRHPYKARFEARYGTELELLARLKTELGVFDEARYE